jgi:diacylglycerol kinase family enzyme
MAPDASNQDGVFDLCIAHDPSRMRVLTLLPHFLKGSQFTQKELELERASKIKITAIEGSLPAHVDGETLCKEGKMVDITLLPMHLEVVCRTPESHIPV